MIILICKDDGRIQYLSGALYSTIWALQSSSSGNIRKPFYCEPLEATLVEWVCEQYACNVSMSDELIRENCPCLLDSVNRQLPVDIKTSLQFRNGLLHRFRRLNRLKRYLMHGDSADTDVAAIRRKMLSLQETNSKYALIDLLKENEYGIFYMMPPTSTVGSGRRDGQKN